MEKKTLHVVSCLSYRGTLKNGLFQMGIKDEIAYLPIDFSLHYIPKDFSDTELMQSVMSLNILGLKLQEKIVIFNQLKEFVTTDYSNYEKVIVWHGWSADELLLLYLMSVLVGDNLYHIDIATCEDFMKNNSSLPYLDMGRVSPYDIYIFNMPSFAKAVTDKEKIEYTNQWNRWKNSSAPYRFSNIHSGVIEEYPADFMDETIIKYAENESKFIILVGKVHKEFDCLFISDNLVLNRILELYWEHKLDIFVSVRNKESVLNEEMQEIDRLRNQMNRIREEINIKLNQQDVERWRSYISSLQEIVSKISTDYGLKAEILFVNEDINSHLCIRFYKEGWDLSIVFEKYDYNRNQNMFVYIGIPTEQRVDSKYQYMRIFKEFSEKPSHPYGWEWIDKYCGKPEILQEDIENGDFQSFLEKEVGNILVKLEEKRLPMK